jgi:hypothetical protein
MRTDGQTGGYEEVNMRFLQLCERAWNLLYVFDKSTFLPVTKSRLL